MAFSNSLRQLGPLSLDEFIVLGPHGNTYKTTVVTTVALLDRGESRFVGYCEDEGLLLCIERYALKLG
jgi:hypothetical protein